MVKKEYISRKDLRDLGFTDKDVVFVPLLIEANQRVGRAIEADLISEISSNHTKGLLAKYLKLLESNSFFSVNTQHWIEEHIPSFHQIETECREMVLGELLHDQN